MCAHIVAVERGKSMIRIGEKISALRVMICLRRSMRMSNNKLRRLLAETMRENAALRKQLAARRRVGVEMQIMDLPLWDDGEKIKMLKRRLREQLAQKLQKEGLIDFHFELNKFKMIDAAAVLWIAEEKNDSQDGD